MSDVVKLLPDSIANQIAAGEVIQRPASVIKELMENAIDAGSTEIKIIIKNAGKTLIQVVDNGKGMSYMDARMCFERHATSKISSADDLFKLQTLGFRGEALASIAAIAHVELKTQPADAEMGSFIKIEGSKVLKHEVENFPTGSNLSVKNLFYNVPARRKFLKSDPVELKHIIDEFLRVVIPNENIFFSLFHNNNELYHLPPSNFRQRISNVFGKQANENIVPVEEETDFLKVVGYVGKPDFAKKSRGEQFLFINKRYIKSNYLNHAIRSAFESLIPKDQHPFFVIMMESPPESIDINIHPTKQEVKFENERLVYNYLRVCVKHALGKYSIAPSIDFDLEEQVGYQQEATQSYTDRRPTSSPHISSSPRKEWVNVYENLNATVDSSNPEIEQSSITFDQSDSTDNNEPNTAFRTSQGYIINPIKSGFVIIDQQYAHERILYDRCLKKMKSGVHSSQKTLFPETIELTAQQSEVAISILPQLKMIGVDLEKFGARSYVIQGLPLGVTMNGKTLIENLIEEYVANDLPDLGLEEKLAAAYAKQSCIKRSKHLNKEEINTLIDDLFASDLPYASPSGHKCFVTVNEEEIKNYFN